MTRVRGAIQSDAIQREVMKNLLEYTEEVGKVAEEMSEKYAKLGAKMLKASSPVQNVRGGGAYARGWRAKKVGLRWVIHNATDYQLTHLLEKGHARVGGGDRVPARVHIRPVERQLVDAYIRDIEEAINNR